MVNSVKSTRQVRHVRCSRSGAAKVSKFRRRRENIHVDYPYFTLKALLRALDLHDDDPTGRELAAARERALQTGLASFEHDQSPIAELDWLEMADGGK